METHKAKIGDKIIITDSFTCEAKNGEIYTVAGLYDERHSDKEVFGVEINKYNEHGEIWINEEEYEAYETN